MASRQENAAAAIALLPENGDPVAFEAFKQSATLAGIPLSSAMPLIRQSPTVEFGFADIDGERVHVIRRSVGGE